MKKKLLVFVLALVMALATLGMMMGCEGPQGPQGEQGPVGPQGPQGESGVAVERIYQLAETFTYVSHTGLKLFSIRVWSPEPILLYITITNFNMPGLPVSDFVRARSGNSTFLPFSLGSAILLINDIETRSGDFTSLGTNNNYIWFGTPTSGSANSMLPFVIFRVR